MNSEVGTVAWMAPEVFSGHYTEKADVFSLGALYFAILERDFVTIDEKKFFGAFSRPLFGRKVGLGLAMSKSKNGSIRVAFSDQAQGSHTMKRVTLDALKYNEDDRPTAAEVLGDIEGISKELQFWMEEVSRAYCTIS